MMIMIKSWRIKERLNHSLIELALFIQKKIKQGGEET